MAKVGRGKREESAEGGPESRGEVGVFFFFFSVLGLQTPSSGGFV